jgi:hypothetical protein
MFPLRHRDLVLELRSGTKCHLPYFSTKARPPFCARCWQKSGPNATRSRSRLAFWNNHFAVEDAPTSGSKEIAENPDQGLAAGRAQKTEIDGRDVQRKGITARALLETLLSSGPHRDFPVWQRSC